MFGLEKLERKFSNSKNFFHIRVTIILKIEEIRDLFSEYTKGLWLEVFLMGTDGGRWCPQTLKLSRCFEASLRPFERVVNSLSFWGVFLMFFLVQFLRVSLFSFTVIQLSLT